MREGGNTQDTVEQPWAPASELSPLPADKLWAVVETFSIEEQIAGADVKRIPARKTVEICSEVSPGVKTFVRIEVQENGFGSRVVATFGLRSASQELLSGFAANISFPPDRPPSDIAKLAKSFVKAARRMAAEEHAEPVAAEPGGGIAL